MSPLNKGLYNFLHNICEQPRWACLKENGVLVVYLCGGNFFAFDGKTIISKVLNNTKIKIKDIDLDLVAKIYSFVFGEKNKRTSDEQLKDKYKIQHKRLTPKDREAIAKYEEAINGNRK